MSIWLVGVDAGGTSTRAAAVETATGTARVARGAGANWTVSGPETCRQRIAAAVREALPPGAVPAAAWIGVAGYYPPDHRAAARAWTGECWPGVPVEVAPDVAAAWAGAHARQPGTVVVAGTGSIVYGRDAGGREARAGGWGPLFSDEGSAYDLGRASLRALSQVADGMLPPSDLAERLMARWPELGSDLTAWLRGVYRAGWQREQVAAVAGVVARAAPEDALSAALVGGACERLWELERAVRSRLALDGAPACPQGGLFQAEPFRAAFAARRPAEVSITAPRFTPLAGAVLQAAALWDGPAAAAGLASSLRGSDFIPEPTP